ncbi:PucR family transcriptional regulator [Kineosporia succinea]|uniref:Membrane protein YgcG n=1 Tax=Kineosporia succinea TaxID=84632 RepID=A0ABT9P3M1_9ACTN|nr:helix-turn-helix domain-containing protein [Kineosporia succinea]MDP9827072.1 putative membrane protein YgcG [Kineosporia succinea]
MTAAAAESDPRALQELVDDVSDLLQAPAVLEDLGFALVAYGSQSPEGVDQVRAATILRKTATSQVRTYFLEHGIASATGPVRIPADESRQIAARVCIPVRSGGRTHGYLWVVEPPTGVAGDALARVTPLADRAGVLLARRAGVADERASLVDAFLLEDASDGAGGSAGEVPGRVVGAWRRLVELGEVNPGEPFVVADFRRPGEVRRRSVLSVPVGADADLVTRRVTRQLPAGAVAGVSEPCGFPGGSGGTGGSGGAGGAGGPGFAGGPGGVGGSAGAGVPVGPAIAARQAAAAAVTALARPQLGPVLSWSRLGFYRVLASGPAAVEALVAGTPAALLREKADADLIRTVLVWLDSGGNAARTAAALSVHRQTLYYRLERVEQLTGVDLDEGEARLGLHLGLALGEVLARSGD